MPSHKLTQLQDLQKLSDCDLFYVVCESDPRSRSVPFSTIKRDILNSEDITDTRRIVLDFLSSVNKSIESIEGRLEELQSKPHPLPIPRPYQSSERKEFEDILIECKKISDDLKSEISRIETFVNKAVSEVDNKAKLSEKFIGVTLDNLKKEFREREMKSLSEVVCLVNEKTKSVEEKLSKVESEVNKILCDCKGLTLELVEELKKRDLESRKRLGKKSFWVRLKSLLGKLNVVKWYYGK